MNLRTWRCASRRTPDRFAARLRNGALGRALAGERFHVEILEQRALLSASGNDVLGYSYASLTGADVSVASAAPTSQAAADSGGGGSANQTPPFSPSQVAQAYGFNNIFFPQSGGGLVKGDGTGQTIAIVVAYQQPNLAADLHTYDQQFGLADPQLTICNQSGSTNAATLPGDAPKDSTNWGLEASLDVEWAHALAPGANILVVEANSNGNTDLYAAVDTARNSGTGSGAIAALPKASVVSMSWGTTDFNGDANLNNHFVTPSAKVGNTGVTFLAATGDQGAAAQYPATANVVVGVGGTTLTINSQGNYGSETAWGSSNGSISTFNAAGSYQQGVTPFGTSNPSNFRMAPDVAFDGSGNSGLFVYDSYDHPPNPNPVWLQASGTSVGTPCWAALVAIADQGRAVAGAASLTGAQTLAGLYSNYTNGNYAYAFHDVTSGINTLYSAGSGYDLVTGLGTPRANVIAATLAGFSETPTPAGPAGTITTLAPTFQWSAVGGATGYLLTIIDTTTNVTVANGIQVTGTQYTPSNLLSNGDSFQWQVQAFDNNGTLGAASSLTSFTTAAVVNHAPAGGGHTAMTYINTPYTFTIPDFSFADPLDNPPNNFLAVRVSTAPAAGTLTDNGQVVGAGSFVSAADIASGLFVFTPQPGTSGTPYAQFTFQVQDDGGTANGGSDLDPSPNPMTINVLPIPQVNQVLVDGSTWSSAFLSSLGGAGYAIPAGSAAQLSTLPWINLNQVQIVFSEGVHVQQNSLTLTGISGGTYAFSGFSYNSTTFTATWTLAAPLGADRLSLDLHASGTGAVTDSHNTALDGDWTDQASTFPSGDGVPGGDFDFSFNVLPADTNSDGVINGLDVAQVASNWLQSDFAKADLNGDSVVNGLDIASIASHWLTSLPPLGGGSSDSSALVQPAVSSAAPLALAASSGGTIAAPTANLIAVTGPGELTPVAAGTNVAMREADDSAIATLGALPPAGRQLPGSSDQGAHASAGLPSTSGDPNRVTNSLAAAILLTSEPTSDAGSSTGSSTVALSVGTTPVTQPASSSSVPSPRDQHSVAWSVRGSQSTTHAIDLIIATVEGGVTAGDDHLLDDQLLARLATSQLQRSRQRPGGID